MLADKIESINQSINQSIERNKKEKKRQRKGGEQLFPSISNRIAEGRDFKKCTTTRTTVRVRKLAWQQQTSTNLNC